MLGKKVPCRPTQILAAQRVIPKYGRAFFCGLLLENLDMLLIIDKEVKLATPELFDPV
jgi:hypothetical protein